MEQLQAYWVKIKDSFWSLVSKIESSVLFERLVSKYEALPPRHQKTYKSLGTILAVVMVLWFSFSPLLKTRLEFAENRSFFSLISSMKLFNSKLESSRKEYVPPVGWQNLSANDMNQLEDSITVMMASLGIPEDRYEIGPQGDTLLIHVREATVKQLESFMFQIDGLYPRFHVVRNKTSIHPTNKELIQFEIDIGAGEESALAFAPEISAPPEEVPFDPDNPFSDEALEGYKNTPTAPSNRGATGHEVSLPPGDESRDNPAPTSNGGLPGFEPPTFSPLDGDPDGDYAPSNRGDNSYGGGGDFSAPPMGNDFIPPPPPSPDDESFDVVPIPDDELPPQPPIE